MKHAARGTQHAADNGMMACHNPSRVLRAACCVLRAERA